MRCWRPPVASVPLGEAVTLPPRRATPHMTSSDSTVDTTVLERLLDAPGP